MQGKANFMVILDEDLVKAYKRDIKIGLYNGNKKVREIETNFLGPFK